jgi:uncharacterized 2Fe-2S/4Fe-4S cluster protein (DUF4445 family)
MKENITTGFGIALDIGTTTVSAQLVDLNTGSILDNVSQLNEQNFYGLDILRRIHAAQKGKTQKLYELINRQTEKIIKYFIDKWSISKIEKLSVSGNTVMLHLFLNIDPSSMGQFPFTPVFLEEKELHGESLLIPAENISILPSISAFIGADITSGLAVLDIFNSHGPSLLVDIGTNAEMALVNGNNIHCCSAAAGPAFEGVHISCGMGGVKGAIKNVELISGEYKITSIDDEPPVGICGSGLIDVVAIMLKQGIIGESGLIENEEECFTLCPGIKITGRDIREFQLAKSAIHSGIKVMCSNASVDTKDIKNVFITGNFGFSINKQNAVNSGIFPMEFLDKITACGNLSLQGAVKNLTDKSFLDKCRKIKDKYTLVDLALDPSFADEFTNNMFFTV